MGAPKLDIPVITDSNPAAKGNAEQINPRHGMLNKISTNGRRPRRRHWDVN
jgi:hypothetical protein